MLAMAIVARNRGGRCGYGCGSERAWWSCELVSVQDQGCFDRIEVQKK
jgi:hypothetical protein